MCRRAAAVQLQGCLEQERCRAAIPCRSQLNTLRGQLSYRVRRAATAASAGGAVHAAVALGSGGSVAAASRRVPEAQLLRVEERLRGAKGLGLELRVQRGAKRLRLARLLLLEEGVLLLLLGR